ncbi:hypothetical protein GCM10009838_44740 [Catenulispora subtropica]|uniref:Uncharacterized protein n=1 Tax=Catenulispora subtropica TaxID=450798 RepID=A0ABN2S1R3_9ACTN
MRHGDRSGRAGPGRRIGLVPARKVVVRAEGDITVAEASDPQIMVGRTGQAGLAPVADQAAARLAAALDALGARGRAAAAGNSWGICDLPPGGYAYARRAIPARGYPKGAGGHDGHRQRGT